MRDRVFDDLREQLQALASILKQPRATSGMRRRATNAIVQLAHDIIDVAEREVGAARQTAQQNREEPLI